MSLNLKNLILCSLALLTITSCEYLLNDGVEEQKPIARVYESYLYLSDLEEILPEGLSEEDSLSFIQNYINVWAKNQLMVYKAEFNLTEEQKRFEQQIENYRNDLLKYTYLEKYVDDQLDTNIASNEVRAYYNENKSNFLLKENILRLKYVVVPVDAPKIKDLEQLFLSNDSADQVDLEDYVLSYSRVFSTTDTSWISFDEFNKLIPIETFNQQEFLNTNSVVKIEQDNLLYLAQIKEFRIKDNPSPLPYVYDLIKSILINKRRMLLIENLEKNLLSDAIKKTEFETY